MVNGESRAQRRLRLFVSGAASRIRRPRHRVTAVPEKSPGAAQFALHHSRITLHL
jgi:hypothetical protein